MTFNELGLIRPILRALDEQGYKKPTPIQEKAIPAALRGRDVLGCAQTGTGKTCAFAAPILQRLSAQTPVGRPIRALILTPTRELAIQIQENFAGYGRHLPLRSAVIFGGVGQNPQVEALKRGVDILTATPGRLLDLQGQGYLDFSHLEIFVLDEADRMLDMGFIHDVRRVLKLLPERKQTLFFSATMPPEIVELVNSLLHDPVKVAVDPVSSPVEVIRQKLYFVDKGNKTKLLAHLVSQDGVKNALVFTRTKHGANKVAGDLVKAGVTAAAIHGNKSQTARQQALADFKAGRIRCLVATDIAARGLDIEELSHVFNYNLPEVPETYVHRIGRTGRAGHGGTAISFCDFGEKEYLKGIEKLLGKRVPVVEDHPWPMEIFETMKDAKGRVVNADDAEARQAAREKRRERQQSAGERKSAKASAEPPVAGESSGAESAPGRKKPAGKPPRQGRSAPAPKPQAAPERPIEEREHRSKRGYRHQDLGATLPAQPAQPSSDFYRPDPLAGDVIMDATARLLAPRKLTLSHGEGGRPDGRRGERPGRERQRGDREKKPPQGGPNRREKAGGAQAQGEAPKGSSAARRGGSPAGGKESPSPAQSGGGRGAKPASGKQPPKEQPVQEKRKAKDRGGLFSRKSRDGGGGKRPAVGEKPLHSGQRDSTEQPSLMKPYYIHYDD